MLRLASKNNALDCKLCVEKHVKSPKFPRGQSLQLTSIVSSSAVFLAPFCQSPIKVLPSIHNPNMLFRSLFVPLLAATAAAASPQEDGQDE